MDHIDEHLASASVNLKYDPAIRAALGIGKRTLNRYYSRTDQSELYRIAMGTCKLSFMHDLANILLSYQSYTPATSYPISSLPVGLPLGSRQRKTSSAMNLIVPTDSETTFPCPSRLKPQVARPLPTTFSTIFLHSVQLPTAGSTSSLATCLLGPRPSRTRNS
jgi:hypothetical protein